MGHKSDPLACGGCIQNKRELDETGTHLRFKTGFATRRNEVRVNKAYVFDGGQKEGVVFEIAGCQTRFARKRIIFSDDKWKFVLIEAMQNDC